MRSIVCRLSFGVVELHYTMAVLFCQDCAGGGEGGKIPLFLEITGQIGKRVL
jgi:hypothetical protein